MSDICNINESNAGWIINMLKLLLANVMIHHTKNEYIQSIHQTLHQRANKQFEHQHDYQGS